MLLRHAILVHLCRVVLCWPHNRRRKLPFWHMAHSTLWHCFSTTIAESILQVPLHCSLITALRQVGFLRSLFLHLRKDLARRLSARYRNPPISRIIGVYGSPWCLWHVHRGPLWARLPWSRLWFPAPCRGHQPWVGNPRRRILHMRATAVEPSQHPARLSVAPEVLPDLLALLGDDVVSGIVAVLSGVTRILGIQFLFHFF
mmetsp:Transcript_39285/g.69081  ORF Transcript_39285/g.69081 Transcript_39285/m.69081 type:complete len:201 (+) Transcript_39285:283-885(+)